jgi:hypothetical protein
VNGGGDMGDVVNLNKYRKQRQRLGEAKQAAENRVKFGRDKGERASVRAEQERSADDLDGKHLDGKRPDDKRSD